MNLQLDQLEKVSPNLNLVTFNSKNRIVGFYLLGSKTSKFLVQKSEKNQHVQGFKYAETITELLSTK